MASRRKRGPVALRHQLWLDLPLSGTGSCQQKKAVNSGLYLATGQIAVSGCGAALAISRQLGRLVLIAG